MNPFSKGGDTMAPGGSLFKTRDEAEAFAKTSGQTRNIVMFPGTEDKIKMTHFNGQPILPGEE